MGWREVRWANFSPTLIKFHRQDQNEDDQGEDDQNEEDDDRDICEKKY